MEKQTDDAEQTDRSGVLIVDDNENIIFVIQEALSGQTVDLYSATSGREALPILERVPIDLVLLDARMPDMNGFDVCQRIKTTSELRGVKVMIISASNSPEDKLRAFHAGADDYITKPFRTKEFQARVQVMLNLRRAEQELLARTRQLEELLHISQVITQRLDLRTVADSVVRSAASLVNADVSLLMLWDESRSAHRLIATTSTDPTLANLEVPADMRIAGAVFQTGEPIIVADYHTSAKRLPLPVFDGLYAIVGAPLKISARYIGVIVAAMARPDRHFRKADLDVLSSLANQGAIAIENARLYGELHSSEKKYRLLTEKASDPIFLLDPQGVVTYMNERVETLLGYSAASLIGKHITTIISADQRDDVRASFTSALHGGPETTTLNQPILASIIKTNGASIDLEFSLGLLYENDADTTSVTGVQAIARDVSERMRAEVHERWRAIGELAAGVAHDFNNVLANILGHSELLSQQTTDPEMRDGLRLIRQAARDGAETVRRIQESTGQREASGVDFMDVNAVVQNAIDLTRPRWRDTPRLHGLTVTIEQQLQPVPLIKGKEAQVREVLVNLINNAVDAMPNGGTVRFSTRAEAGWVYIGVSDTGKGMPTDVKRHIFEPFYTTKGVQGTGLGLSVAAGIIQRHGGEFLEVESAPNIGTTITMRLPQISNNVDVAEPARQSLLAAVERRMPVPPPLPDLPRRNTPATPPVSATGRFLILAVDDEIQLRSIMVRALNLAKFDVLTAADGTEALALFTRHNIERQEGTQPFAMVFTDLGMPGMSGWELAHALKTHDPTIPIVIVTGWGDLLDAHKMAEIGIDHTIAKPFSLTDITDVAKRLTSVRLA